MKGDVVDQKQLRIVECRKEPRDLIGQRRDLVRAGAELGRVRADKERLDSTIDNGATWQQMRFLARVFGATRAERFRAGFLAGLDYLFAAEHAKGGWPQIY